MHDAQGQRQEEVGSSCNQSSGGGTETLYFDDTDYDGNFYTQPYSQGDAISASDVYATLSSNPTAYAFQDAMQIYAPAFATTMPSNTISFLLFGGIGATSTDILAAYINVSDYTQSTFNLNSILYAY